MSEKVKNISASIRQRLLNLARERKDELQLVLVRYGVERLLYRLSTSPHGKEFVLKGAMLFQIWTGQPHRSTLDVDLLGSGDDEIERLVNLFKGICSQTVEDDGLVFLVDNIQGGPIREDQRYGGVRIQLTAMLATARIPIQIDIGFGDAITPKAEQVEYPTLLGQPAPMLRAYPKVTVVAEKYAFVSLAAERSIGRWRGLQSPMGGWRAVEISILADDPRTNYCCGITSWVISPLQHMRHLCWCCLSL